MSLFSRNLKYLRTIEKLSQEDVGKIVGKDRSLISQWESDDKNVSVEDIAKLSDYFNVSMDNLVGTDLSLADNKHDELDILFDKHKDILTDDDKEYIKFIIEKRKKEIDKELGEG